MDYKTFTLENYLFCDELRRLGLAVYIMERTRQLFQNSLPMYSVYPKDKTKVKDGLTLEISKALGFSELEMLHSLSFHRDRLKMLSRIIVTSFIAITILFTLPTVFITIFLTLSLWFPSLKEPPTHLILEGMYLQAFVRSTFLLGFAILIMLYTAMIIVISIRLAPILINKYYADSLCVTRIINVILELSRDDVLSRSDRRKSLLLQMNYLAHYTLLISQLYTSEDEFTQKLLKNHFKEVEHYIRERERWVIVPVRTTLADLRRDFYQLAPIYISGDYGNLFRLAKSEVQEKPELSRWHRFFTALFRFVGFVLPPVVMGLLLLESVRHRFGIQFSEEVISTIALIFIAWLVFTTDFALNLGVVSGILKFAKDIKELR